MDVGAQLRLAREKRGWSRDELSARTKISPSTLEAIEECQVDRLPPVVFLRGFLSSYAAEVGLPAEGFVFCNFSNSYKITPQVFDIWMRLLHQVAGSVLWLYRNRIAAETNLRREASARGIDPARLIFAERIPLENHLARHRLADLFLDTLPYNAHTTASDALWMGVPVLTCLGQAFAGRVAGSLLHAVGPPELVTGGGGGCQCGLAPRGSSSGTLALLLAVALLRKRRRPH